MVMEEEEAGLTSVPVQRCPTERHALASVGEGVFLADPLLGCCLTDVFQKLLRKEM